MSDSQRLGRYVLDRKLATGGMAEIWLAHQPGAAGFEKQCVIKRILPHLADDEKFVGMFLDEARLAANLSHPNIGQIFDLGEVDGSYYIAMEYIDGYDLERIIQRSVEVNQPVPAAIAARLVADACTALDYAHSWVDRTGEHAGIVHRDISPQNILVSRQGVVKLVDFGVAKARTSSQKTQTGAVKGKLSYMSPEQITAKPLDGRSDIFAMGIVLYELLTSQRPFGHESELLAVTGILHDQPRAPRELYAATPPEMERIIMRALMKDPNARYPSAADMRVDLERALHAIGQIVTDREVARYLADLFSANPSGLFGGTTNVTRPAQSAGSAPVVTLPHHQAAGETAVHGNRDGYGDSEDDEPAPRSNAGMMVGILLVLVLVVGAAGTGLWYFVFGPGAAATDAELAEPTTVSPTGPETATTVLAPDVQGAPEGTGQAALVVGNPDATAIPVATPDVGTTALAVDPVGEEKPPEDPTAPDTAEAEVAEVVAFVDPTGTETPPDSVEVDPTPADDAPDTGTPEVVAVVDSPPADAALDAGNAGAAEQQQTAQADTSQAQAPARPGTIQVRMPGGGRGTVFIDGREVGNVSGAARFDIASGSRRVRVVHTDGREFNETVRLSSGGNAVVTVRF